MADVYAVIMAGGAGTRFWPASRAHRPKQLLALGKDPNESLLAATVRRLNPLVKPKDVFIATGAHLSDAIARDLPGVPRAQILAEPTPRNTAPCIGWATAVIAKADPDALIAVLPSDHTIADEPGFRATIERAFKGAREGYLTTIGIVPTRPETGYGYVEVGDAALGADGTAKLGAEGVLKAKRFVEKPDRARAEEYVRSGHFLWNAGMFFFRARVMLDAIRAHLPELAEGLDRIDRDPGELGNVFPKLPSISIDHGVMERAAQVAVVKGDFGWNDIGSWESAWELASHDEARNAAPPGTILVDAKGNLVRSQSKDAAKKVIALMGVENLVVVDTDDALLVMPRERAQDVRAVVDALKAGAQADKL
jgi:mannose-1-phosphate guanylyltransferase